MAKLCPRGKAAAKRKFKVYPSAYANMYASAVCSGKVTPGGKKNRKKKAFGGTSQDDKRDVRKVEQMIGGAVSSKREMGREKSTIPPRRFLKGTKKTQSGSTNFIRNVPYSEGSLKEAAAKLKKENPGFRITKLNLEDLRRKKMGSSGRQSTKKRQVVLKAIDRPTRINRAGGGMMNRLMYGKGGGVCIRGMNKDAVGKNS